LSLSAFIEKTLVRPGSLVILNPAVKSCVGRKILQEEL
jgi:hypothetical protein